VAAFTAAGLSLVSGVLTYRLSRRSQLEQWRQNEERPAVAQFLARSREMYDKWCDTGFYRQVAANLLGVQQRLDAGEPVDDMVLDIARSDAQSLQAGADLGDNASASLRKALDIHNSGSEQVEKVRLDAAQLDLIASDGVREVAGKLVKAHLHMQLFQHPANGRDDWHETLSDGLKGIGGLHKDLVNRARADLGTNRNAENRLRSQWQNYKARRRLSRLRARFPAYQIEAATHPSGFVAITRATGRRAALANNIEQMEALLFERQLREEGGESPGLIQGL